MHLQRLSLSAQAIEASSKTFWCIVSCLVSWSYFFSSLVSPSLVSFLKSETSVSLTSHRISTLSEPACELRPKPTSLPNGLGPHGMLWIQQGLDQASIFIPLFSKMWFLKVFLPNAKSRWVEIRLDWRSMLWNRQVSRTWSVFSRNPRCLL